ncbi:MAG: hypothetical protein HY880_01235 [Deltaproteobacteria bacterium]|nr:hypothetical protein [Deltaproteobacteria bacterium]
MYDIYRSLFYRPSEEVLKAVPQEVFFILSDETGYDEAVLGLKTLGFNNPEAAMRIIKLLKGSPSRLRFPSAAASLFERLLPLLFFGAARSADPDRALGFLERFTSAVGAKRIFYSLLIENPKIAELLANIFGASVFLSKGLIEHPANLDLLLSPELSKPHKTRQELSRELEHVELFGEETLDELRMFRNREVFRIAINDIHGVLDTAAVSEEMTLLAEALIEAAFQVSFKETSRRYGPPSGLRPHGFAILGLGKLGGRELIYGSDLDMVFVYADNLEGGETVGQRIISNREFFIRLGQRIITTLSLRTKEGFVFDVDMRLRPSGSAGPLVISKGALIDYYGKKTEVWERQAFIKARAVAGDMVFAEGLLAELSDIIYSRPPEKEDVAELVRIRKRMEHEIAKETETRYNIKTGKGGLVDIEFLVQALQLRHGHRKNLRTAFTIEALDNLKHEGLIADHDYLFLKEAHGFLRLIETSLRIVHDRPEGYMEKGTEELKSLARRLGFDGEEGLMADYSRYRDMVREIYLKTLGGM